MARVQCPSGEPHSLPALAALAWGEQGSPALSQQLSPQVPAGSEDNVCWTAWSCCGSCPMWKVGISLPLWDALSSLTLCHSLLLSSLPSPSHTAIPTAAKMTGESSCTVPYCEHLHRDKVLYRCPHLCSSQRLLLWRLCAFITC